MMGKFTSLVQGIKRLHNESKKGELTECICCTCFKQVLTNTSFNNLNPVHLGCENYKTFTFTYSIKLLVSIALYLPFEKKKSAVLRTPQITTHTDLVSYTTDK